MRWLWLALLASADAHVPGACPPLPVLGQLAEVGRLDDAGRECLRTSSDREAADWIAWRDDFARTGPTPSSAEAARALLARTEDPDRALVCAELWAGHDEALTSSAVDVAVAHSERWHGVVLRDDRVRRLTALGSTAPLRPPDPPSADELEPCADVGVLWSHALDGKAYATERDCVARALDGESGDVAAATGRLALALAMAHRDVHAGPIVAARVRDVLPDDPAVAARGQELSRSASKTGAGTAP